MKLYLIRHGETDANRILNHGIKGPMHDEPVTFVEGDDTNIGLNVYGRKQAQRAAQELPDQIDTLYSSALLRALETADIIASEKGIPAAEIIVRPELAEYYAGSLEGLSADKKIEVAGGRVWGSGLLCTYDYTPWGGDSWQTIYDRVNSFMEELKQHTDNHTVIAGVTSAGVIRMAYKILLSQQAPEITKHITITNGSVHEFILV